MRVKTPASASSREVHRPASSSSSAFPQTSSPAGNFKDMLWVVQNWVLKIEPVSDPTVFRLEEKEIFYNLLYQMHRDCPQLVGDADSLTRAIQTYPHIQTAPTLKFPPGDGGG